MTTPTIASGDLPLLPYSGSSPLCYSNSLVMALKDPTLPTSLVETLTGSAFGYQLPAGALLSCDPYGWDPEAGIDQALRLLGYDWQTKNSPDADEAMEMLRSELARRRPVYVGPVDMGLLAHQPSSDRVTGADHYVAVLDVTDDEVWMHDPQGHPWAALPIEIFLEAWRADEIDYVKPYTLRCGFTRTAIISPEDALRSLLPEAASWAQGRALPVTAGTLGGASALLTVADQCEEEPSEAIREILTNFSLRLGARRRQDTAMWLARIHEEQIAGNLQIQARILGGLQYPMMIRQWKVVADRLRTLARTQSELVKLLSTR